MSAGSIVAALPPVAMFFLMQKALYRGTHPGRCEVMKPMDRTYRIDDGRQTLVSRRREGTVCPRWSTGAPPLPQGRRPSHTVQAAHVIGCDGRHAGCKPRSKSICPEASAQLSRPAGIDRAGQRTARHCCPSSVSTSVPQNGSDLTC